MVSAAVTEIHPPPLNLTALPTSVVAHITSYLDQTSLVTFARVSRFCYQFLDDSIWRELRLSLSPYHGWYPSVSLTEEGSAGHDVWTAHQEKEAQKSYESALRDKVKSVLCSGDASKFAKIRTIRLDPRPSAAIPMITLLELASASVETLVLEDSTINIPSEHRIPPMSHDTFDSKLIGAGVLLFALSHLEIGRGTTVSGDIVLLLCSMAPNLDTAIFHPDRYPTADLEGEYPDLPFTNVIGPTRIRKMRFSWEQNYPGEEDETGTFDSLLSSSPRLRELSLGGVGNHEESMDNVVITLREHTGLQDLHWDLPANAFPYTRPSQPGFMGLRRLVLWSSGWCSDIFSSLPRMANLESIYLSTHSSVAPLVVAPSEHPSVALPMVDSFANTLRASPRLHKIYRLDAPIKFDILELSETLDTIDTCFDPAAFISSIRHGDEELLHARILLEYVEVADLTGPAYGSFSRTTARVSYTNAVGQERTKIYHQLDQATWQDYVDFRGRAVPLDVIQRMKDVDGRAEKEWAGRGVTVGAPAWKVLTDWIDAQA